MVASHGSRLTSSSRNRARTPGSAGRARSSSPWARKRRSLRAPSTAPAPYSPSRSDSPSPTARQAGIRSPSSRNDGVLSGRRAQAARNDQLILDAARAVFVADPGAPISAVAEHAGVGISALYRRYASKEELLRQLCGDGLRRHLAEAEAALADDGDPWTAFSGFMRRIVDADTHSLTLRLAGTFTPTEELYRDAAKAQELNERL